MRFMCFICVFEKLYICEQSDLFPINKIFLVKNAKSKL
ncbi:hypothetical protein Y59_03280 [Enterobacter hormaechei]|nr:hypothetical protein Y59_03280 [Enterobacter hormaechei]